MYLQHFLRKKNRNAQKIESVKRNAMNEIDCIVTMVWRIETYYVSIFEKINKYAVIIDLQKQR